jgi:hypothetical protein
MSAKRKAPLPRNPTSKLPDFIGWRKTGSHGAPFFYGF